VTNEIYPGADTTTQWYARTHPGDRFDANCGVFHTTEGANWPGYEGGATAPNLTIKPMIRAKTIMVRQHFPVNMSSRSLVNLAGGVETNTLNVEQIELIGTCDPTKRIRWKGVGVAGVDYIYWPDAPDWLLNEIAKVVAWFDKNHGIAADTDVKGVWTAYPDSYGPGGQRFSNAHWKNFYGWCGHQHVPENVHGDPGAFDFPKIQAMAAKILQPVVPPTSTVPAIHYKRLKHAAIDGPNGYAPFATGKMQRILRIRGYLKGGTLGNYGTKTRDAVKDYQKAIGHRQTGVPTRHELIRLVGINYRVVD
jgi:hypothetical protein